jgi:hypothetical protein
MGPIGNVGRQAVIIDDISGQRDYASFRMSKGLRMQASEKSRE